MATALKELKQEAQRRGAKKPEAKTYTVADFIPEEDLREMRQNLTERGDTPRAFDQVDQFCAEVIARFGYEVYQRWNAGEIPDAKVLAWLAAERSREARLQSHLETVIVAAISACVKRRKGEKKPKGLDKAASLIKENIRVIKGERNG